MDRKVTVFLQKRESRESNKRRSASGPENEPGQAEAVGHVSSEVKHGVGDEARDGLRYPLQALHS